LSETEASEDISLARPTGVWLSHRLRRGLALAPGAAAATPPLPWAAYLALLAAVAAAALAARAPPRDRRSAAGDDKGDRAALGRDARLARSFHRASRDVP